jgi:hypothetical protein
MGNQMILPHKQNKSYPESLTGITWSSSHVLMDFHLSFLAKKYPWTNKQTRGAEQEWDLLDGNIYTLVSMSKVHTSWNSWQQPDICRLSKGCLKLQNLLIGGGVPYHVANIYSWNFVAWCIWVKVVNYFGLWTCSCPVKWKWVCILNSASISWWTSNTYLDLVTKYCIVFFGSKDCLFGKPR